MQTAVCMHCVTACYYSVTTLSVAAGSARRPGPYRGRVGEPGNGCEQGTNTTAAVPAAACQLCGTPVPPAAVTWMVENTRRGTTWTCPGCARAHLRSIEAKLDTEYW